MMTATAANSTTANPQISQKNPWSEYVADDCRAAVNQTGATAA